MGRVVGGVGGRGGWGDSQSTAIFRQTQQRTLSIEGAPLTKGVSGLASAHADAEAELRLQAEALLQATHPPPDA